MLDKGTYDAIALSGEAEQLERYRTAVRGLMNDNSLLVLTSCNFTRDELTKAFAPHFQAITHINYPTFRFGGSEGSRVATVAFRLKS